MLSHLQSVLGKSRITEFSISLMKINENIEGEKINDVRKEKRIEII
jgi:hypothetical protein